MDRDDLREGRSRVACGAQPNAEERTNQLVGEHVLRDARPENEQNPEWRTAKLLLKPDGLGQQTSTFKDSRTIEVPLKWKFDGRVTVSLGPLKDCSWAGTTLEKRQGLLEKPTRDASRIVSWAARPSIIFDPDLNPTYDWIGSVSQRHAERRGNRVRRPGADAPPGNDRRSRRPVRHLARRAQSRSGPGRQVALTRSVYRLAASWRPCADRSRGQQGSESLSTVA
jgi:hypothetical protein